MFIRHFLVKIGRLLLVILAAIRRALCCIRRRRHLSDTSLPITGFAQKTNEVEDLQNWSEWNEDTPTMVSIISNHGVTSNTPTLENGLYNNRNKIPSQDPEMEDFFQDMIPQIKKTKKILIRQEEQSGNQVSNLSFTRNFMDSQGPILASAELDTWDDTEGTWEEDADTELDWNASLAIQEQRRKERERRAAENHRRKMEKDALRSVKRDSLATKIS